MRANRLFVDTAIFGFQQGLQAAAQCQCTYTVRTLSGGEA